MSTKATNGSKMSSTGSSSTKTPPQDTTSKHTSTHPEPLYCYLADPAHSNAGYASTQTDAVAYVYGFPEDAAAQEYWEEESRKEAHARLREYVGKFDEQMGGGRGRL